MYTIEYRDRYNMFNFRPFVRDIIEAKECYLRHVWWGCKAVRIIDEENVTIWETVVPVIQTLDNPNITPELPF